MTTILYKSDFYDERGNLTWFVAGVHVQKKLPYSSCSTDDVP